MQFHFGSYVVDLGCRELKQGDALVAIQPQVFDLLVYLLRNRDRMIGKDELVRAVWDGRTIADSTFTSRINAVRRAIGDDGKHQKLIRTYQRKGIRFVGELREVSQCPLTSENPDSDQYQDRSLAIRELTIGGKPSVAVLPFRNLNTDASQAFICEGLTEDITTDLSRHRSIFVIARGASTSPQYRGMDIRQIGQALGAHYIVDGSVRCIDDRVRVSAELIETNTGRHIWAERSDRDIASLSDLQNEIPAAIAAQAEAQISVSECLRIERKSPPLNDAWDVLHLGMQHLHKAKSDDNKQAQWLFRRALELDPTLARAYAYLAYAIVLSMTYFDERPSGQRTGEAIAFAKSGVQLDEQDAMNRFVYGRALLAQKAYTDAHTQLKIGLELNPNLAVIHCGLGDCLAYEGRIREAIPYFEKAVELGSFDPQRWAFFSYGALAHIFAGDFNQASEWATAAIGIPNCHYWPYAHRVAALGHGGQSSQCATAVRELMQQKPNFSIEYAQGRLFYVKSPEQIELYVEGLRKAGVGTIKSSINQKTPV